VAFLPVITIGTSEIKECKSLLRTRIHLKPVEGTMLKHIKNVQENILKVVNRNNSSHTYLYIDSAVQGTRDRHAAHSHITTARPKI
jgi:hypothetical protein